MTETKMAICKKCNHTHEVPKSILLKSLSCGARYFGKRCGGSLKKN